MRPLLIGLAIFLSLLLLTQYLAYQRYVITIENEKANARNEADAVRDNLTSSLSYSLAATKTLAFIVKQYGEPSNFDSVASVILQSSKYIDALELTRGGVITHVYPLKGNESVVGYDVLKDPVRGPEAYKAIEKKALYFAGPFELKQGGTAVVGRLPLFEDNEFRGFSVVLIKLETLLEAAGIDKENPTFQYQLAKKNPVTGKEEYFLPITFSPDDGHAALINVPDGEWSLYVKLRRSADVVYQILPLSLLGIFLSVTAGLFVWYLIRQPQRLNELVKVRTTQVQKLSRLFQFTSRINQLMVKLDDEPNLLQEVCNAAVDTGGFTFAWIAVADTSSHKVHSRAHAGAEQGYLNVITPLDLRGKAANGPVALMISTRKYVYCNDIATDPLFAPWASAALSRGFRSCILLPLIKFGEVIGSLNLYSTAGQLFDEQEIKLLTDVGEDISFTLENIEREKMFREAVQQTESEKFLSDSIINSLPGVFYLYDRQLKFTRWNRNMEIVSGYTGEELANISPLDLFAESEKELLRSKIDFVFSEGYGDVVAPILTKQGIKIPYFFNGKRVHLNGTDYLIGMGIDITERVEAENNLIERSEEIRKLTGYLQQVREEERKHISREIHDELGQQLTGLKMDSSWLRKHLEKIDSAAVQRINEMMQLIDDTIKTVRRISSQLRPGILDDLGLIAALDWQVNEFEKRTGIKTTFTSNIQEIDLPERLCINIFRIFQEALTNVARHAKATQVTTDLIIDSVNIALTIADNGEGIDATYRERNNSLGIVGMKERARLFDGDITIERNDPKGTIVQLIIPANQNTFASHEISDLR